MKIGITTFCTAETLDPLELGRIVEGSGLDGIYLPEHTHIPTSRKTPYPGNYGSGLDLPESYKRSLDPLIALTLASTVTDRIELGTCVCLLAQRDPIVTAKAISSLDRAAAGRFRFGVGFGWNVDEAEQHGVEWKKRFSIVRDKVAIMRALWTDDVASYDGPQQSLAPSWQWPKPLQERGPEVLLGGGGPTSIRHVAEWADGWLPVVPGDVSLLPAKLGELAEAASAIGRDPESISISVAGVPADPEALEFLERLGVARAIISLESCPPHQQRVLLASIARAAGRA